MDGFQAAPKLAFFCFFGNNLCCQHNNEKLINTWGQGRRSGLQGMDGQQQEGIISKRETECTRDSRSEEHTHGKSRKLKAQIKTMTVHWCVTNQQFCFFLISYKLIAILSTVSGQPTCFCPDLYYIIPYECMQAVPYFCMTLQARGHHNANSIYFNVARFILNAP